MDYNYLLCDELLLSTTPTPDHLHYNTLENYFAGSFYTTKEDCEQAMSICLEKELSYMPQHGYIKHLRTKNLFFARFRAIHWLIKSRSRLNLSFVTLFNAANYFDRFLSMNQCNGWKNWMVDLLSVACLSVATKFNETSAPSLHEIQLEDLDHSFQTITIQRMELVLLQALEWRLSSRTAYSYVELLTVIIEPLKSHLQMDLAARVTDLLLESILDSKLVEYKPSIIAVSAIWCGIEELIPSKSDTHLGYITGFFNQDHKDDIVKCHNLMEEKVLNPGNKLGACGNSNYCPSSPVTVLFTERIDVYDSNVDLSLFKVPRSSNTNLESPNNNKRKREAN